MESKKLSLFNKISFVSLLATFFLSIFFFVPFVSVSLDSSKGFLLSLGVTISVFFWLIARLVDGKFVIPRDRILLFGLLIPIVFLISSFFSSSPYVSFFGRGFEVGTFGSMLVLFLVLFLSSIYFQTEKRLHYFFKSLFFGAGILALVQIVFMFVSVDGLVPGLFKGLSYGNMFGTWENFALFFGGMLVLSLATLELRKVSLFSRISLWVLTLASLFFLVVINNYFVWILTGIFTLIIFVYSVSSQPSLGSETEGTIKTERSMPILAFGVILVCLLFIVANDSIGPFVQQYFGVVDQSVVPSFGSTFQVAKKALLDSPVVGTGPNTFVIDWSLWKPTSIITTPFWNADFSIGVSTILTFIATTGILGVIVWILFLAVFVLRGIQSMKVATRNTTAGYFIITAFFFALYFWIALMVMNGNAVILMIAFASTGVFVGALAHKKVLSMYDSSFLRDPRTSFFSILTLVVLMIAGITTAYVYVQKYVALAYFSRSQVTETTLESTQKAERMLLKAVTLDKNDVYYRGLSEVYLNQVNLLSNDSKLSEDTLKSTLQSLIQNIEDTAGRAISQNPKYYTNWVALGDVYNIFASMGVSGATENAQGAYVRALELSPNNPRIILAQAQLAINNKDTQGGRTLAQKALEIKPNYTDALFVLAAIEKNAGNTEGALRYGERATIVAPNDRSAFYQLGIMRYDALNYTGAVSAFESAVILDPTFVNARYFLAMSYEKAGRTSDAVTQLNLLLQLLPNNAEVQAALNNIKNGTKTTPVTPVKNMETSKTITSENQ